MNGRRLHRWFRRDLFRILLVLVGLAMISMSSGNVLAQEELDRNPHFAGVPFTALMCIKPFIPFVWVRTSPSSNAGVRGTLYPQDYARVAMINGLGADDGVQRWIQVSAFPTATQFFTGWVEQFSFVGMLSQGQTCPGTSLPSWIPPHPDIIGPVALKPGVPFAWQRSAPSSYAPVIESQLLRAGQPCRVPGPSGGLPILTSRQIYHWDGVQWWVQLGHVPRESSVRGWVEAISLQGCP